MMNARVNRYPTREQSCLAIPILDYFQAYTTISMTTVISSHSNGRQKCCSNVNVRETGFCCSYCGEEFGVILPHTPTEEAEYVLTRLRVAVSLDSTT
ncbi:hypothetical protein O9929_25855 [Vibrio lentus]|nr:hypothetical protein [Vibrio lentus]